MGTSDLYLDWDTLKNLFEMIFALLLLQLVLYNVEGQFLPNSEETSFEDLIYKGDYQGDYRGLPRMEKVDSVTEKVLSVEDGEYGEYGEDGEDGEYGEGMEKDLFGEDLEAEEDMEAEEDGEDGEDGEDEAYGEDGEDLEDLEDLEYVEMGRMPGP